MKDNYGKTALDYISNPGQCVATFQIQGDQEFRSRMQTRLKFAEWLQTAASLHRIEGLTSEAGQHLNGKPCQRMSVDKSTGRHVVRLSPSDPQPAWKKLKPENLKSILKEPASNDASLTTSDRCHACWTTAEER